MESRWKAFLEGFKNFSEYVSMVIMWYQLGNAVFKIAKGRKGKKKKHRKN